MYTTTIFTRTLATCWTFVFCVCIGVGAEQHPYKQYPYTARITQNEATVYSSPEKDQYATQKLKAGDTIEIYQENANGWCAIRPPVGSFSWISGAYVETGVDHVGTISAEILSSRIGSQFGDICKTIQVQLTQGEKVHLLGRVDTPENAASPYWFKIAPPSGEFRWIHKSSFSDDSPNPVNSANLLPQGNQRQKLIPPRQHIAQHIAQHNGAQHDLSRRSQIVQASFEEELANVETNFHRSNEIAPQEMRTAERFYSEQPSQRQLQQRQFHQPQPLRSSQYVSTGPTNNQVIVNPAIAPQNPMTSGTAMQGPNVAYRNRSSIGQTIPGGQVERSTLEPAMTDPYQREFYQLNREAHIVLNRPTDDAVFETMIQRAARLIENAPSEYDRTRASQLYQILEQSRNIRKTNAIQREYVANFSGGKMTQSVLRGRNASSSAASRSVAASPVTPPITGNPGPTANPSIAQPAPTTSPIPQTAYSQTSAHVGQMGRSAEQHSPYKAQGRLGWFSQRPEGHPPFALVNEQGQIVSYITPQGVDLKPYIDKQIGVNGTSGFYVIDQQQRAPHISATSVFLLR